MRQRRKTTAVAVVAGFAVLGALLAGTARPAPSAVDAKPCSFQLRIGDVLPFTGDLAAYGAGGVPVKGFPKLTAGWAVASAGAGDMDGDGKLELALATRDGNLFVWRTAGNACQATEWPKNGHDLHNTGVYGTDATRPGTPSITRVTADPSTDDITVSFTGTGDDGECGAATRYRVSNGAQTVEVAPGTTTVHLAGASYAPFVSVQAIDEAGNAGFAATHVFPRSVLPRTGSRSATTAVAALAVFVGLLAFRRTRPRRAA